MAFDAGRGLVVLFGGRDPSSNVLGDTWTWSGGAVTPPPPTINSVVSAFAYGGFSSVAPGSWVEIYGTNLAPDTRPWAGPDFNDNNAPTSLDGVEVIIGGQKAFVDYISSLQVNVQLPSNIPTGGPLQLTVTNGKTTSTPVNVQVDPVEPGLLAPPAFLWWLCSPTARPLFFQPARSPVSRRVRRNQARSSRSTGSNSAQSRRIFLPAK